MAKLTITDAARVTGVSRVTLHRYIKAGKLSRRTDGTSDTVERLRIGLVLQPETVLQPVALQRDATPSETPPVTVPDLATLQQLITVNWLRVFHGAALLVWATGEDNSGIREWGGQKNAADAVAQHGPRYR
jgi:hypothetical protein